jgi:adenylate kinase
VLDGYPRTLAQAQALDRVLEQHGLPPTAAVLLRVDDEEIVRRLSGRQRQDDSAETVRRRLQEFHHLTVPIAEHYRARGILHEVPGVGGVEEVYNRIKAVLKP